MKNKLILGIGNILLKDDGIGIHVVNELLKEELPDDVEVIDGGTGTIDTLNYFMDFDKIVVVDALKADLDPGTIYKIAPNEILNYRKENLSIHEVQILDVVKMANMLGKNPEVVIIGIEPKEIDFSLEPTELIQSKIPKLIEVIKKEMEIL